MVPTETDMLLVVDVQRDFCQGGKLPVPDGDAVVAPINLLIRHFPHVVAVQDWHPPGHSSFASAHSGAGPFEVMQMSYGLQTLWPDHCVQGTPGADFHAGLDRHRLEMVLRKGFRPPVDSYSAFLENDHATSTGLAGYLRERGFRRVVIAGLTLDYCVRFSAEDARALGFDVVVVTDARRGIGSPPLLGEATAAIAACGAELTTTRDMLREAVA